MTSAFIRVCVALGLAYNVKSMSGEGIRDALYQSVSTDKKLEECLAEAKMQLTMPVEQYLQTLQYI